MAANAADVDAQVAAQLKKWREQLVDLSRRNRLVNLRRTQTSTVGIIEPSMRNVLDGLDSKGGWRFHYPPPPAEETDEVTRAVLSIEDPDLDDTLQPDELLTDAPNAMRLSTTLRNLERRATQEVMDRGLHVLHVAVGLLSWQDSTKEALRSPLLLLPVDLLRPNPRTPFRLRRSGDDAVTNPALAIKLATEFEFELPPFEVDVDHPADYIQRVRESLADSPWTVSDEITLSYFWFQKEAMYQDLLRNEEALQSHPLIRAIASGPQLDSDLAFDPIVPEALDEAAPPEGLASILDADSTQRSCIVAARDHRSFVMDGPPGTGKSQTIANMIAELLAAGSSVLFVSDKAPALDVVLKRLEGAGLGEFILEMHSSKTTRKEFATQLGAAISTRVGVTGSMATTDLDRVTQLRRRLSAYASAMNRTRGPLSRSLHDVLGLIAGLDATYQIDRPDSAADLDDAGLARLRSLATDLADAWGPVERGANGIWRDLDDPEWAFAHLSDIRVQIAEQRRAIAELRTTAAMIADALRLDETDDLASAERLATLLELCADRPPIERSWLCADDLAHARERGAELRRECLIVQSKRVSLDNAGFRWDLADPRLPHALYAAGDAVAAVHERLLPRAADPVERPAQLAEQMQAWPAWLRGVSIELREMASALGLGAEFHLDLDGASTVARLAAQLSSNHRPPVEWFDPATLARVRAAVDELRPLIAQGTALAARLEPVFNEHAWELDAEALFDAPTDLAPQLSRLRAEGRHHRKNLAACSRSGEVDDAVEAACVDLRAAQRLRRQVIDLATRQQSLFAAFGPVTDPASLARFDAAVNVVDAVIQHAPQDRVLSVAQHVAVGTPADPATAVRASQLIGELEAWATAAHDIAHGTEVLAEVTLDDAASLLTAAQPAMSALANTVAAIVRVIPCQTLGKLNDRIDAQQDLAERESKIAAAVDDERSTVGPLYAGLATDWAAWEGSLAWAEHVRDLLGGPVSETTAREIDLCDIAPDTITALCHANRKGNDSLVALFEPDHGTEIRADLDASFDDADELLAEMEMSTEQIEEWAGFVRVRAETAEAGWQRQVQSAIDQRLPRRLIAPAIERSVLSVWADGQIAADPDLQPLASVERDQLVAEYQRLDRQITRSAIAKVADTCNGRRPTSAVGAAGVIQRAAMLKRRHPPIRELIRSAGSVILDLKPCIMMSPLSVSQYLPSDLVFDVVIFDEASQVRPCDAANAIYRGRSLVVAGDNKQLPPTSFFEREIDEGDEWEEGQIDDFESVLDLCKASGSVPSLPLCWHYRSQHESLITYSNRSFYDARLITFPSSAEHRDDLGLELIEVDGCYDRGGARDNPIEAKNVVERVFWHAEHYPHSTLGVVAFSDAQARRIELELEYARQQRPDLDSFFGLDRLDGFFVKNLESVQGDERDTILFSVGYGPDANGKFTMNFGPLNREGGERRLNVAITRARQRVEVVASFNETAMTDTGAVGVRHLKGYLGYARLGPSALETATAESVGDTESPFEDAVLDTIRSWGFAAEPQIGQAGYRIDIGIRHPDQPGRFVLGVECDGAAYHSSPVARDRDRLRGEVLERLGWTLYRIWGPAWYRTREVEERRLREAIEAAIAGRPVTRGPVAVAEPDVEQVVVTSATEEIADGLDDLPWATYEPSTVQISAATIDSALTSALEPIVVQIVREEGPVSAKTITNRIRLAANAGRMGAKRQGQVQLAIRRALDARTIMEVEPGFFLAPDGQLAARRPSADPDSARSSTDVALGELQLACEMIVQHARRIEIPELTRLTAKVFGWQRQGAQVQERIQLTIRTLTSSGRIVVDADGWVTVPA